MARYFGRFGAVRETVSVLFSGVGLRSLTSLYALPAGSKCRHEHSVSLSRPKCRGGAKLIAAVNGGYIYTSTDSGAIWVERASVGSENYMSAIRKETFP